MSKLLLYRASAGSGKTYKLTEEYLRLLFKNPGNYKNTLAVTFTNKATSEMKGRIMKELHFLAENKPSGYHKMLKAEFNLSNEQVQQKAQQLLYSILHDYARFSVSTIDSFFQQVIRNFVKELGLQSGYNIELDDQKVLHEVIDELLFEIEEKKELQQWLTSFALEKIQDGQKWNFQKDIQSLGYEVFKEEFKTFDKTITEKLTNKSFLNNYLTALKNHAGAYENKQKDKARRALEIINSHNLAARDFKHGEKRGVGYFFQKIADNGFHAPSNTIRKCNDNVTEWYKKDNKQAQIEQAYHDGLGELLQEIIATHDTESREYNSVPLVSKHLYTLGILSDISKKLRDYSNENNIFLLSEASGLIKQIIKNNDAPFIYEKFGNFYRYFMIDEFQDTSDFQWENFQPLIENSLSEANGYNLIVGDVKQSIYRWRNGNWKILTKMKQQFDSELVEEKTLGYNWRSKKNIIEFNNFMFSEGAAVTQEIYNESIDNDMVAEEFKNIITAAYADCKQKIPAKSNSDGGYVNISFLQDTSIKDEFEQAALEKIPGILEKLQDQNIAPGDIAILVRNASQGKKTAQYLLEYQANQTNNKYSYDVISNEAMLLSSAGTVNFITALLRFIVDDKDDINKLFLMNLLNDIETNGKPMDFEQAREQSHEALKERLKAGELAKIKHLPLFEMVEKIIQLFELEKITHEIPYLQAFQEVIHDFSLNKTGDLFAFLTWWAENSEKQALQVSEQRNAVGILTVHKSKGLQFRHVIVPFCNWLLDHNTRLTNILWCRPESPPFNNLDIVPVNYTKKLEETIFHQDYYNEKMLAFVDHLNLLYVSFTRAEEGLHVMCPYPEKPEQNKPSIANLVLQVCRRNQSWSEEQKMLKTGRIEHTHEPVHPADDSILLNFYPSGDVRNNLRIKYNYFDFFQADKTGQLTKNKVNYGKLMHEVFEKIILKEDLNPALDELVFEGKINSDEKHDLSEKILNLMSENPVKQWFEPVWNVKNEADIILPGGKIRRPDRVMTKPGETVLIDYKFGLEEKAAHHQQLFDYGHHLAGMGYKNIKAWIWYVDLEKVTPVNL